MMPAPGSSINPIGAEFMRAPILYLVTAIAGGALARLFYPGALHMAPVATALLGVPGAHFAELTGRAFHPGNGSRRTAPAGLVYATLGALLLTALAEAALAFTR